MRFIALRCAAMRQLIKWCRLQGCYIGDLYDLFFLILIWLNFFGNFALMASARRANFAKGFFFQACSNISLLIYC